MSKSSRTKRPPKSGDGEDDLINSYIGGTEDGGSSMPDDAAIEDMFRAKATEHADDAVDYEDIDELAEDEEIIEKPADIVEDEGEDLNLQQEANDEFDNMFGDDESADPNLDNNRLLEGGLDNNHLLENGFDMDVDGLYGDDFGGDLGSDFGLDNEQQDNDLGLQDDNSIQKRKLQEEERQTKRLKLQHIVNSMEKRQTKRNLRYYFPHFKSNKPFNNHHLFLPEPKFYKYKVPSSAFKPKPLIPTKVSLEADFDQYKIFKTGRFPSGYGEQTNTTDITGADLKFLDAIEENGGIDSKKLVPLEYLTKDGTDDQRFIGYDKNLILATADWDDDAIISGEAATLAKAVNLGENDVDEELEHDDDDDVFNGRIDTESIKLDMNDPNLLFERAKQVKSTEKSQATGPEKTLTSRFNLSNDRAYDLLKSNYNVKVRSQIGNLDIEHSVPAIRLQSPYYKVKLSKEDARSFHRPKFNVAAGTLISFSKIKQRKRKKDKGKTSKELFSKSTDLTTGDNATLIGMEYAEEYPMIFSNYGMGSKLINYYRREKPDDNSRPKAPLGETHVLGVEDRSPFWNFGNIDKGDFVPTLYNNMIRAPIFKQEKKSTDFLLVKSQGGGNHQKYFLKNLDHIFGVGHTFPSVEIPAPHSRKVTNTSKNRLKMIVFRTMNKSGKPRISVKDISHHFPDQNDMQNRQRLKEFMEYQKGQDDAAPSWKIKNSDTVPDEESIRMMITPEDVALLDSMQSGQQVLDDLTIFLNEEQEKIKELHDKEKEQVKEKEKEKEKEKDKEKDKKESDESIDEQLSCWNLTRNFVLSNQTKSMLQLNGEGDPTGIGIGYSLLKTSQKSSFTPFFPPPKENVPKSNQAAYQQRLYEAEVARIWSIQRKSLAASDPVQAEHNLNQVFSKYKPISHQKFLRKKYDEIYTNNRDNDNQILRIHRRFRDKNGIVQRKVETIKDPRIIKAYLRRKKQIEDDLIMNTDLADIKPTDDPELNKIRKKALEEHLASLERRAKHHKGRKPGTGTKDPLRMAIAAGGKAIDANKVVLPDGSYAIGGKGIGKGKSLNRRCKACGAYGHIRTKKTCPLYNQTKGGTIDISKSQSPDDTEGSQSTPAVM